MNEHEEARKIELHDGGRCLQHDSNLVDLNLLVVELQARIVGPQQLHIVLAAEDAQGNETVISLAYHGSFTVWWVGWSPDLEVYEEDDDDWVFGHCAPDIPEPVPDEEEHDANDHPV